MELRSLSKEGIPEALAKAEQYRLLNEPEDAESICLDVLEVEPHHQEALVLLLLARTDQLERGDPRALDRARRVLPRLDGDYRRAYYGGIVCERQGKSVLRQRGPRASGAAYDWFRYALEEYQKAIDLREPGDDAAILRWNTCVRLVKRHGLEAGFEAPVGLGIE